VNLHDLVSDAERLGAAAGNGEMTQREAAHQLKQIYPALTIPGALEVIRNWRDIRQHYGLPPSQPQSRVTTTPRDHAP
jgi:hypothetical protein